MRTILFILIVFYSSGGFCQQEQENEHAILLINKITHKTKQIKEKQKIRYWLYSSAKKGKGTIEKIQNDTLIIDGKIIPVKDLRKISTLTNGKRIILISSGLATAAGIGLPFIFDALWGGCFLPAGLAPIGVIQENVFNLQRKWDIKINTPDAIAKIKDSIKITKTPPIEIIKRERDSIRQEKAKINNYYDSIYCHTIKINPAQLAINEITLSYERRLNKKFGVETTLGIIRDGDIDYIPMELIPLNVYKGIIYKQNLNLYNTKKLTRGYTSFMFLYKYMYYDKKDVWVERGSGHSDFNVTSLQSENIHVIGLSLLTGVQPIVAKRFVFDLYAGLGVRMKIGSRTVYDKHLVCGGGFHFTHFPYEENILQVSPIVHLGLKIGYHF